MTGRGSCRGRTAPGSGSSRDTTGAGSAGPAWAAGRSIAIRGRAWRRSRRPASSAPPMPSIAAKTWTGTGSMPSSSTVLMSRYRPLRILNCGPLAFAPSTTGHGNCTRSRTAGSSCFSRCLARHQRRPLRSCCGWRSLACPPASSSTGSALPSPYCTRCGSRSGRQRERPACRLTCTPTRAVGRARSAWGSRAWNRATSR